MGAIIAMYFVVMEGLSLSGKGKFKIGGRVRSSPIRIIHLVLW
jgi:hypothetical protein